MNALKKILFETENGKRRGIYSCCSVNRHVIDAVLLKAKENDTYALIEATANQVSQTGGYTGMTPQMFFDYAHACADELCFPKEKLILGGDHLGPTAWQDKDEEEAMALSDVLVHDFVLAGYEKIHLDTSVRLKSDVIPPDDRVIAERGARLCLIAEKAFEERKKLFPDAQAPLYIIGSEVPIPGGIQDTHEMSVTKKEACLKTVETYREVFTKAGLEDAFSRVIGLVVQPGVEFGNEVVIDFDETAAAELSSTLKELPNIVFEGHSTDYQTEYGLSRMVQNGYAILKVGPELTFAMRESLFALESVEKELFAGTDTQLSDFRAVLDKVLFENGKYWKKHCFGDERTQKLERAFGFSDRCRYIMPDPAVREAEERLIKNLSSVKIPLYLLSQYLPNEFRMIREGKIPCEPIAIIRAHIGLVAERYLSATCALKQK